MRSALLVLTIVAVLSGVTTASPAATLGSSFADSYATFAPLYEFYRSYADYLFAGSSTTIPPYLDTACDAFPAALETLHLVLITQTASTSVATLGHVVRLRSEAAAFCARFGDALCSAAEAGAVDAETLDEWSDTGLFVSIYGMNRSFELTLDAALDAEDGGRGRWDLAVAFALRSLLLSPDLDRVSPEMDEILYGVDGASAAPLPVPPDVAAALATLVAQAGKTLEAGRQADIVAAAALVYAYVMSGN